MTPEYIEIKPDDDTNNSGNVNEDFPSTTKYEPGKIIPFLPPLTHITAEYIEIKPDTDENTDNSGNVNEIFPSTINCEPGKINPFSLPPLTHTNKNPSITPTSTIHSYINMYVYYLLYIDTFVGISLIDLYSRHFGSI